jgi:hypothetical protein
MNATPSLARRTNTSYYGPQCTLGFGRNNRLVKVATFLVKVATGVARATGDLGDLGVLPGKSTHFRGETNVANIATGDLARGLRLAPHYSIQSFAS